MERYTPRIINDYPNIDRVFTRHFSFGLLVATGTLAHTYVFKGSAQSMLRTVIICTLSFTICMMLGTLTVNQPVLYGVLLLIVTVIPFYVFNVLKLRVLHPHSF